jgi:hypothetical protein
MTFSRFFRGLGVGSASGSARATLAGLLVGRGVTRGAAAVAVGASRTEGVAGAEREGLVSGNAVPGTTASSADHVEQAPATRMMAIESDARRPNELRGRASKTVPPYRPDDGL